MSLLFLRAMVLKHHVMIPHEKLGDSYFFRNYLPLWNYAPLKKTNMKKFCKRKSGRNFVSAIFLKVFKLEA